MAASATLALKAGVWFRRGLLLIVSPVRGYHRRYQAETPLIDLFKFASPALIEKLYSRDVRESIQIKAAALHPLMYLTTQAVSALACWTRDKCTCHIREA